MGLPVCVTAILLAFEFWHGVGQGCVGTLGGIPLHASMDGALALGASLPSPLSAVDDPSNSGNVLLTEGSTGRLLRVDRSGVFAVLAGGGGDSTSSRAFGATASLSAPLVSVTGSLPPIITDERGTLRRYDPGTGLLELIAGNLTSLRGGPASPDGTPASESRLSGPFCLHATDSGDIYFCDGFDVRVIRSSGSTAGLLETAAGNGTSAPAIDGALATATGFYAILDVFFDTASGDLLIADNGIAGLSARIFRVSAADGYVVAVAGAPYSDLENSEVSPTGPALQVKLTAAHAVCTQNDTVYFTDGVVIYRVNGYMLDIIVGNSVHYASSATVNGMPATSATFLGLTSLRPDAYGGLIFTDSIAGAVFRANVSNETVHVVAGSFTALVPSTEYYNNALASSVQLPEVSDVSVDSLSGDVFVAVARANVALHLFASNGTIRVIAGTGAAGCGTSAASDSLYHPTCAELDGRGGLIICDFRCCLLRRIDIASGAHSVLAGNVSAFCNSTLDVSGPVPELMTQDPSNIVREPRGATIDPLSGDLYWAEPFAARIMVRRAVDSAVYRVAGGFRGYISRCCVCHFVSFIFRHWQIRHTSQSRQYTRSKHVFDATLRRCV